MPLFVVSIFLFALRLYAATRVGFGDSEALYACWAAHPQPAYLDHPGLVGLVARTIGGGAVPIPIRVHVVTAVVATLVPWLVVLAARAFGAASRPAMVAGLVVALVPETAIGLFALTPDLLLAPLWLGALALATVALESPPAGTRAAAAFLGSGLLAAVACAAKVSGLLLVLALFVTYASMLRSKDPSSKAVRTIWPWAGLLTCAVVLAPIVLFEARSGWPMLQHRLVDTQESAGIALRNAGGLVLGQLAYLSPIVAWLAVTSARDLVRRRGRDARSKLAFYTFIVPLGPLVLLTLWSRVAEPHWIAPALLSLPLHAARRASETEDAPSDQETTPARRTTPLDATPPRFARRRLLSVALAVAAAMTLAAHAWVLVPSATRLLPESTDPKLDITSELYGWPSVLEAAREQLKNAATPMDPEGHEVVVVGPHWTICAQLAAGLPDVRVGCATPIPDDFDRWLPREAWRHADQVLYVTDNRFPGDGADQLPTLARTAQTRVRVLRGGRTARVFELYFYDRRASGSRERQPVDREALREARE